MICNPWCGLRAFQDSLVPMECGCSEDMLHSPSDCMCAMHAQLMQRSEDHDPLAAHFSNTVCDKPVKSDITGSMRALGRQAAAVRHLLSCFSLAPYTSMIVVHTRDQTVSQRQVGPPCNACRTHM